MSEVETPDYETWAAAKGAIIDALGAAGIGATWATSIPKGTMIEPTIILDETQEIFINVQRIQVNEKTDGVLAQKKQTRRQ